MPQLEITNGFLEQFFHDFGKELTEPGEIAWIDTGGQISGNTTPVDGGTADTTNRTLTIAMGQKGVGAFLEQSFGLSNLPNLEVGDAIQIHLRLSETVLDTIDSNTVLITMTANNNPVDISGYEMSPYGASGLVFDVVIPYTITSLAAQLKVRLAIKASAPTQQAQTVITWHTIGYYADKNLSLAAIQQLAQMKSDFVELKNNYYNLFPHQELASTYVSLNGGPTTDVTQQIQDLVNDAVAKSGVIEFKKNAVLYTAGHVNIDGALELAGHGAKFLANTTEIFTIRTANRIHAHHMWMERAATSSSSTATSFKFDPAYSNQDSVFEFITFNNFTTHLNLDYAKKAIIRSCNFFDSQYGIAIGQVNASSVSDITISENRFERPLVVGINSQSGNNLVIQGNRFEKFGTSSSFGGRCIVVNVSSGIHSNLGITDNLFNVFTDAGIRIAANNVGTLLEGIEIGGGRLIDNSTSLFSRPIWITSFSGSIISDLTIHDVQVVTKQAGIEVSGAANVQLIGNNIRKHTGTFNNSMGLRILNSTYLSRGNTGVGLFMANDYAGSTILTEY
jgi:hypothetical protein